MLKRAELESNLARVHEWTKSADQKVGVFLALQGIVLTIVFPPAISWIIQNLSYSNFVMLIIGCVLILLSLYKSIFAVLPRLTKNSAEKSITYFGDIAKFSLKGFKEAVKGLSEEQYEDELIEQTYISSGIALRKYVQLRESVLSFLGGVVLLSISFLISKVYYGI